jgi:2-polyprenyl-6-methoxyphenol hydroxylase-like FAD-dependent oxidoreductase
VKKTGLIVGGGIAGMSAAIMLRRAGIDVDLVDLAREWKMVGAGLTISASTLRAFQQLGILDQVQALGHTHAGIQVCDVEGRPLRNVVSPPLPDADIPGAAGILRPVLHGILAQSLAQHGVTVRLGMTVTGIRQEGARSAVQFSDGTAGSYDFIVGSDGLFSTTRKLLFPEAAAPAFTGQACWRLVLPRPPEIDQRHFFLGGPVKVGLTPVSRDEMYLFLLEHVPLNPWRDPATQYIQLGKLLEGFGGILKSIREGLSANSTIVYRPLEGHLLRHDWYRGNAILLGDAAHATTPQLASGAGMAVEDGIVLAAEICRSESVQEAFANFMRRRYERCRLVVENSLEIGRLEVAGASGVEQTAVVERSLAVLAEPI